MSNPSSKSIERVQSGTIAGAAASAQPSAARAATTTAEIASDLKFLDLLQDARRPANAPVARQTTTAGRSTLTDAMASSLMLSDPDEDASSRTRLSKAAQAVEPSLAPAKADPTRVVDEALEMLQSDLSPQDIAWIQQTQTLLIGMPNGLPFQAIMPQGASPGSLNERGAWSRAGLSSHLGQQIESAYQSGKSLRVAMDDRSAIIFKFHGGKVSAEFLTQDQTAAMYLKQSMDALRQRLADKNLPVGDLTYRHEHENPQQQHHRERSLHDDA